MSGSRSPVRPVSGSVAAEDDGRVERMADNAPERREVMRVHTGAVDRGDDPTRSRVGLGAFPDDQALERIGEPELGGVGGDHRAVLRPASAPR